MNDKEFVKEVCVKCENEHEEDCNIRRRMDGNSDCINKIIKKDIRVKDLIELLRDEKRISIRVDNWFSFVTESSSEILKTIAERKIIDFIPRYDIPGIEYDCLVINIEKEEK